jgi:hypothetical protein
MKNNFLLCTYYLHERLALVALTTRYTHQQPTTTTFGKFLIVRKELFSPNYCHLPFIINKLRPFTYFLTKPNYKEQTLPMNNYYISGK